jgi:hypothetical protein
MNKTTKSKSNIDYIQMDNLKSFIGGKGAKQKVFDRAEDDQFFIVRQMPIDNNKFTRTFSSFKNLNSFLSFYSCQKDDEKRYYELIHNECPEYFDLDFKMCEWEGKTKHEKIRNCVDEFLTVRNEFSYHNEINNMTYKYDDLVILESCGINDKGIDKLSLHIIIRPEMNGRCEKFFSNCRDQKIFQQKFEEFLKGTSKTNKTHIVLDMSVYSKDSEMRINDSHKNNETHRKFKPYGNVTKNIQDKRLLFCSYVKDNRCPLTVNSGEKPVSIFSNKDLDMKSELSDVQVKNIFDNLNPKRWEEYDSWRTLIWLGLKLGLTERDIHNYSNDATNYCDVATTNMITQYTPEKCNISLGTLFYYLEKDVDAKKYKELVGPYILDRLTQKKIDSLIFTEDFIEKKERWVLPDVLEQSKCTVIKAGLGKGKTTASVDHINSHNYERIIVLAPRRTFAKSVCNRLNAETKHKFVIYSNLKGKDYMIKNPFVVIQVESLNRLELDGRKMLLLCDEVESVLSQMTVSETHAKKHIENLDMLETLFKTAEKIICLDAFISNRTLDTLRTMKIPYTYYNYTLPLEERSCIKIDLKENFLKKCLIDLGKGKKIFLFSTSNKALTEDFLPAIKKMYPAKKIIEYHSKFTSIDLTSINDNWKDADIVACTSTITVGCNFDLPNIFNKVYVYANASSKNQVRDIFQATYRIRHFIDKEMIYCVDKRHFGVNLSTHMKEIEQDLKTKTVYIVNQYEQHLQMNFPTNKTPDWIRHLVLANTYEQNMSIMLLDQMFQRYLTECSYSHEDIDEEELEQELDMDEEEEACIEDIEYKDIVELTRSQAVELRKKKIESSLTKSEETQLQKYYFQCMLTENRVWNNEVALWDVYKESGKGKFRNLSYEKGYKDGSVRICDIVSDIYPEISSRLALRVELIDQMCGVLGLKYSQDFTEVSKEKVDSCVDWFRTNSKRIHSVFEIRNQSKSVKFTSRTTTDLINKVFSKWGYSKVKAGNKIKTRVEGKVVYTTPYNVVNNNVDKENDLDIDVYEHVRPKTIKQTDRKVSFPSGDLPPL